MPRAVADRTGWVDLPVEIQLQVFLLLKSSVPPAPCKDLSRAELVDWASGKHFESTADEKACRSMILLDTATFRAFAPFYYQDAVVCFQDANDFHNKFLINAMDACLYNLKYISCILNVRGDWRQFRDLRWLEAMIKEWPELANLVRFEVIFILGQKYLEATLGIENNYAQYHWLHNVRWNCIDIKLARELSIFERRALRTTFAGYEVTHAFKPNDPQWWHEVEHMSLTFLRVERG